MAITIENEFDLNLEGIQSKLISAFCKPVLYFKVTSGGSGDKVAEVTFKGTNTFVIEAIEVERDGTTYYYIVDLDQILKYLIEGLDPTEGLSDALDFQSVGGRYDSTMFKEFTIDIDFDSGAQTYGPFTFWGLFFGQQIPSRYGFNLWTIRAMRHLKNMKWINDTYNAVWVWHEGNDLVIRNLTTAQTTTYVALAQGLYQIKFSKLYNQVYTYPDGSYIQMPDQGADIVGNEVYTNNDIEKYILKLKKRVFTDDTTVLGNTQIIIYYTAGTGGGETHTAILDIKDNILRNIEMEVIKDPLKDVLGSYPLPMNWDWEAGINRHAEGFDIRVIEKRTLTEGIELQPGINIIEIVADTNEVQIIEIDYNPTCENIPVCFQHPILGYASYPFDGIRIDKSDFKDTGELIEFFNTLVNVNKFEVSRGKQGGIKATLYTTCEAKYIPILKEIYSARHVYLFVGQWGDPDTSEFWVECKVKGGYTINTDKNNTNFEVELELPEHINARF